MIHLLMCCFLAFDLGFVARALSILLVKNNRKNLTSGAGIMFRLTMRKLGGVVGRAGRFAFNVLRI